jgi:peptidoglycan hydrolase-like protein with peptidoglycan-binding domain
MQQITLGPRIPVVAVPTEITVHLGAPDDVAENVNVPYIDYIKNVASSELYPTWPENALIANIHAITSIAMNRIYTEWYRSRGYDFDITNSTQFDQSYVHNRGIFENVANIANNIFGQYIVKEGQIQPYFAQFCDGRVSVCEGMHQWGTVDLANAGYSPLEILRYYYGEDIQIVTDAPIANIENTYPGVPLKLGDSNLDVLRMQFNIDRISENYPAIPKIQKIDGYFGEDTETAVKTFQSIFFLPVTGIIDEGTWYRIIRIFTAVTKLSELVGEGLLLSEIQRISSDVLLEGDIRPSVEILQFALNIIAAFYITVPDVPITGIYDAATRNAILQFQKTMQLPETGAADIETIQALYRATRGILDTLPPEKVYIPFVRWTGVVYEMGHESPGVYLIQEMLSYISLIVPTIPYIEPSGIFDEKTRNAVIAFQNMENLNPTGIVDEQTWNAIVNVYRRQRYSTTPSTYNIRPTS